MRHTPELASFDVGLIAAGKPKKLALIAAMRKLATILNALLRDGPRTPICLTNQDSR